ncbi:MAG TPA: autorepressor SdpR family transcription factor [Gammaproteobacteria bacterium]|nr:autorepressor SdpR family transcription factor [Gammaproteobacteria bacterium]
MQAVFKALSDPTRREILSQLSKGSLSAGALAELFPISRASLSHHFNVLKSADLVRTERRGQSIVYSLNTSIVEEITSAVVEIFQAAPKARQLRARKVSP